MAYQIVVTEYFEETTANTIHWLEVEWSQQSADKFEKKLKAAIERIGKSPFTGRASNYSETIRSVLVTKHNRIYYTVSGNTITLLELFETKQNPKRNRYD